jgi:large subunit ribosomal protein L25
MAATKNPPRSTSKKRLVMKQLMTGHFMNSIVMIELGGKTLRTLPKDVAFHPVTDRPLHVDFLRLTGKDAKVDVQVPVVFINEELSPASSAAACSTSCVTSWN